MLNNSVTAHSPSASSAPLSFALEMARYWSPVAVLAAWAAPLTSGRTQAHQQRTAHRLSGEDTEGQGIHALSFPGDWVARQMQALREGERQRMLLDLHDGLGQSLALIGLEIDNVIRLVAPPVHSEIGRALGRLQGHVRSTTAELRHIVRESRPAPRRDTPLLPALAHLLRAFSLAAPHLSLEGEFAVAENDIPRRLKSTIRRITQEALTNAVRHASAQTIRVRLLKDAAGLRLAIEDDGCGFDPAGDTTAASTKESRCGLAGFRERALRSGGAFSIESSPRFGTRILVHWAGQARTLLEARR